MIFPQRMTSATAGDFQFLGRMMLLAMLKMLIMAVAIAVAATGGILYFFVPSLALAVAACVLLLVAIDIVVIQLAAWAFGQFDVTRDTPPP